jgi:two-component system chemotaxis response regulator CheY
MYCGEEAREVPVATIIVDDSAFARRIIRHNLERMGCTVVGEADNGAQALNLFRSLKPNLITLDLLMPAVQGIDSMTAFRTIRKEDPSAAVLIVTSVPFEKTRDTFAQEGALGYIVKPFTPESFEQVRVRLQRAFPELASKR